MSNATFGSAGGYYRHSGRFSPGGLLTALGLGSLAAVVLGAAYSYLDIYIPIAGWVTFVLTGGTGFALGAVMARLIKYGRIRNVPVALLLTAFAAGLMYVASWEVYVYAIIQKYRDPNEPAVGLLELLLDPVRVWNIIALINANGVWALRNLTPTGIFLGILWLAEAGAIIGIPVGLAWRAVNELPFCEKCNKWGTSRDLINLAPGDIAALRPRLESRDFAGLTELGAAPPSAMHYWCAYLQGCPDCDTTQTLCVDNYALSVDKEGKLQTKKTKLIKRLLLSPEDTVGVATAIALLAAPPVPPEAESAEESSETPPAAPSDSPGGTPNAPA